MKLVVSKSHLGGKIFIQKCGPSYKKRRHRVKSTLIQLEKAKQKSVAFSVRTKLGFEGEKYAEHDAPLLSTYMIFSRLSEKL